MAFAKILSRNDDHRAREIDSDCRVKWCWGWLEKEITLNYGGTDLATTVGEFCRKIESCGIARCVLCDDNTRYGQRGCQALVDHLKTSRHCRNLFNIGCCYVMLYAVYSEWVLCCVLSQNWVLCCITIT